MRTAHGISATLTSLLLLGAVPSAALADHLPDDNAALDQYVASLPEPDGDRPVGLENGPKAEPLPRSVVRELAAAPGGDTLEQVATSVALGAPERQPARGSSRSSGSSAEPGAVVEPGTAPLTAAVVEPDEDPVPAVLGSTEGIAAVILLALSLAAGFGIARAGTRRA
jgi:hypothetical protein